MKNKILICDDEHIIADAIAYAFIREGYQVETAYDGEDGLNKIKSFKPDIAILDVMMPKLDGFEVCRRLGSGHGIGIIMLTVKNDISDRVQGLELGADDYIIKPFDIREVLARVKALLRRLETKCINEKDIIAVQDIIINLLYRKVTIDGNDIVLTPKEFDLLALLFSNINRVFSREELLDRVWGIEFVGGTRTVDIHIQRLRKKLGRQHQELINTVHGIGYRAVGELYEN